MADKKASIGSDILGALLTEQVKQQLAGAAMSAVGKFLESLLAKLFSRKDKTVDSPTSPVLPPGSKPVVPTQDDDDTTRIFSGLRLSIKGIKRDGGHVSDDVLNVIKSLSDPAVPVDVVNLDLDPLDQFGSEIGPGSPELSQLLVDPQNPYDPEAPNDGQESRMRIQYAVGGGDFAINGTRKQYACAANLKVGRDFKGETIAVVSAFATNAQGKTFTSNAIRVRVKGPKA